MSVPSPQPTLGTVLGPLPHNRAGLGPAGGTRVRPWNPEPALHFTSKQKAVSCGRRFDFSGCQVWLSNANVPQVSLSKSPGLGPGAHLSGAAPCPCTFVQSFMSRIKDTLPPGVKSKIILEGIYSKHSNSFHSGMVLSMSTVSTGHRAVRKPPPCLRSPCSVQRTR